MTRIYFEKEFKSFHQAFVEKRDLKTKHNLHCKQMDINSTKLEISSINEESQKLLKELGFKQVKVESL